MNLQASSHHRIAWAWLFLLVLTVLSLLLTHTTGGPSGSGFMVAALVWIKAQIVARYFLELGHAGRVFQRVIHAFMAFGPLGLIMVSWWGHRAV